MEIGETAAAIARAMNHFGPAKRNDSGHGRQRPRAPLRDPGRAARQDGRLPGERARRQGEEGEERFYIYIYI